MYSQQEISISLCHAAIAELAQGVFSFSAITVLNSGANQRAVIGR